MARRLPSIMCCNVSVEMWRMLSITLDTAPGEGGEAPVIKRPKSSEQQPLTQARHNQQHSSTSTCLSTVHHFLILRVYPSAPHLECSLNQSSWEMESWTEARWVVGRGLEDDDGS